MSGTRDLIEKRCRKAIAVVLATKEREADPYLSMEAKGLLRKVILDQFNDLASLCTDLLDSFERDNIINDLWLERLDAIHAAVVDR